MKVQPEAFVEINHPHVAVRLRVLHRTFDNHSRLFENALTLQLKAREIQGFKAFRPRLSTSDRYTCAYLEFDDCTGDTNDLADALKAEALNLGYTLVKERFDV